MKNVFSLVQSQISLTGLLVLIATSDSGKIMPVQAIQQERVAQAQPKTELKNKFFNLIIKGNSKISDLQAAVKSVVYHEDFQESIIKSYGFATYDKNLTNSQQAVQKKTEEARQAQQVLKQFLGEHKDFILSLSPEVIKQATPIVTPRKNSDKWDSPYTYHLMTGA